ncbi:cuticular protein 92F [Leptinotarsa decemlineata]|nr:cuticle protein 18.7 [Leptinotarsa decemlineata]
MMILVLISCALAICEAGYASPYYYSQHNSVILPNGAPLDTPEVQLAKAAHFAAHAKARYGAPVVPLLHYGQPLAHNALPLDTPEVAAAKAQHFHDYAVAAQRNGVSVGHLQLAPGLPVDTPEVQHAKAAHFAAHAEAAARAHGSHYRRRRGVYPLHYPVIDHNGVPVETPEVQAAKAHHFAEYAKVASRPGQNIPEAVNYYGHPQTIQYGAPEYYRGPGGPPAQIGPDGQPIETHEVQAAKAAHFAAHAAVRGNNYGHFGHY